MKPTIERIENAITDFENCECDSEMILYALRILKKLMEEPTTDLAMVGRNARFFSKIHPAMDACVEDKISFKAMRNQLLK